MNGCKEGDQQSKIPAESGIRVIYKTDARKGVPGFLIPFKDYKLDVLSHGWRVHVSYRGTMTIMSQVLHR